MSVEDVFSIKGRGTVATGRIERGVVKVGDEVEIVGLKRQPSRPPSPASKCSSKAARQRPGRRQRRSACSAASKRDSIERGQVLAKPGSIKPHTVAQGPGLRPHARMKAAVTPRSPTTTVLSSSSVPAMPPAPMILPEGVEMVMPGDNVTITIELA
jgi:elongation factor Tu